MSLDHEITAFLASAEPRPATSKLEPYAELIRTLRQRRWTFTEIAEVLRARFQMNVAPSTIHNFLKVRSRRKTVSEPLSPTPIRQSESPAPTSPKRPRFNLDA
jgi:IS30 family transposase